MFAAHLVLLLDNGEVFAFLREELMFQFELDFALRLIDSSLQVTQCLKLQRNLGIRIAERVGQRR